VKDGRTDRQTDGPSATLNAVPNKEGRIISRCIPPETMQDSGKEIVCRR